MTLVIHVSFSQHEHGVASLLVIQVLVCAHVLTLCSGLADLTWFDPEFFGEVVSPFSYLHPHFIPPLPQRRKAGLQFPAYELHLHV